MAKYEAGQRWSYRTRRQDPGSTLLIGNVQKRLLKSAIIHVMVDGVVSPYKAEPMTINHMPFSEKAIDASVLELMESGVEVPPDFNGGMAHWKEQKGGVFDLTVAEAVEVAVAVAPHLGDDPFDALVLEIRSSHSDELIAELYQRLFSLEQWFFLPEPDDPRASVQWDFPEETNLTPALLAFTSRERALSAAVTLGIYPADGGIPLMPVSVKDAVQWITSPDCANDWLCFNLSQENFPLQVADAARLFEQV